MSRFASHLDTRDLDGGKFLLLAPLVYESDVTRETYTVPAGEVTDFASVPRLPVVYLLAGGKARKAAVVHDWMYRTGRVARSVADAIFREATIANGHSGWLATLMWLGVRVGGSGAWSQHREAAQEHLPVGEFAP